MKIEFDSEKNQRNIEERNLPFESVGQIRWTTAVIVPDVRFDYPEPRYAAACLSRRYATPAHCLFTPIKDGMR
ncbi:BrnT family toxin [Neisseria meningitidis]